MRTLLHRVSTVAVWLAALVMLAGLSAESSPVEAAARPWTGAVSTEWNDAGNWTGGIPTSGDDVTIAANVASGRYPVVSTAAANAKTVTLSSGAGTQPTLTVTANTLTVAGNFTVNAGTVTHSGGTIAVTAGAVSITGTLNESAGTFLAPVTLTVNNGGNVNVSSTGVLHMANATGTSPTDNITIAVGGTITQSGGTVAVKDFQTNSGSPNGTYNQSGGTFKMYHDFKSNGTFTSTAGTVQFAAAGGGGTFPNTLGPTQFYDVVCDVDPNFDNQDVSFSVINDWTANAAIDMSGHAVTVTFNGTGTQTIGGSGTTTFSQLRIDKASSSMSYSTTPNASDAFIVAAGTHSLPSGSPTIGGIAVTGGTLNLSNTLTTGSITVASGGTLNHTSGTVTSTSGAVSISGTFNESGGTLLDATTLTVNSGGNLNVSGSGVVHMANAIGTTPSDHIEIAAGGTLTQSGGSVDVRDLQTDAGSPNGTYNQSGGTLKMYRSFKSSGTFNATAGTIQFAGAPDGGTFPSTLGPTQFFNVVCDVEPKFDTQAVSFSVAGDWTANAAVDMSGKAVTVTFNGTGAQAIGGPSSTIFRNLTVNKSSGTATLAGNQTVKSGDLTVTAGTLDLSSYTLNRSAAGGTLTVSNGAFLKIGGTNSFPTNYTTHTLGATSTVDYNGTNQTVTAESYGHLTLSGSGTKTMPGSSVTIAGNFTMSGTASATAAQALTVNGNFTLGNGTTFGAASYSHGVKGNFSNSGTFTASTSTFTFDGTSAQTIGGSNATTFNAVTINNANGVSLSGVDVTAGGTLTFTSGKVTTGSNTLAINSTGSVSRTSGHVIGNFKKYVATGATSRTFEIGDSNSYAPVSIAFSSVTTAGDLTASTTAGDHPNVAGASINASKSVNRYWSLTNSGVVFSDYSATFTFVAGDIDGGASTSSFIVGKYSGGTWSYPTVGTKTATTTQITGATAFSDFEVGEGNATTLGNGTDPSNATIAPGGSATMADAFTFVTNSGSESISAITVTLASGTSGGLSLVEITDDAGSTVYGSVSNPGSDTPAITLSTPITATTSSTQYKIRVTPRSHANMPAPAGSSYAVTAYVSAWTGTSSHTGTDSGGTTVTIDNLSPGNVTSSTTTPGNAQVSLAWTNPADSDLDSVVVLRRASSAVTDAPVEGTTYTVGTTIGSSTVACVVTAPTATCTDSGLTNGTPYHYKIFAKDSNGNYATGATPTGSPATPDVTTLGNGTDPSNASLAPGGTATMVDAFTFATASSTDSVTAVVVTLATGTSGGLSLVEITDDAGSTVYGSSANPGSDTPSITLTTPISVTTSSTQYKIRITPKSHADMPAPAGSTYSVTAGISNWTGTHAHAGTDSAGTTVTIDNLSPSDVSSASVTAGNNQNSSSWTNPGDSDLGGIVVLRRASSAVTDTPAEGATYTVGNTIGSSTVACVVNAPTASCIDSGLTNDTAYHYKIFAKDSNGNYATGVTPTGSPATPRGAPIITITKLSSVVSDPVNGATNPLRIPGAVVEYSITPSNSGNGSPTSDTVVVTDVIASATLAVNVTAGVTFVDGTTSSALTLGTVSYSSTPAPGPYVYNYTPTPDGDGYDGNVTAIKVNTTGVFAWGGSPAPGFTVKYRVRVK